MVLRRSAFAGDTNYIGADIGDLRNNLADWIEKVDDTIAKLILCRPKIVESRDLLDDADAVVDFNETMIGELRGFAADLGRIFEELGSSVDERHVEMSLTLYRRCRELDYLCRDFKAEHINVSLKYEDSRPLLDTIYAESRSMVLYLGDLLNFSHRLKTFVGKREHSKRLSVEDIEVLHLKPNIFGVGVNLNYAFKRIWRWKNARKR